MYKSANRHCVLSCTHLKAGLSRDEIRWKRTEKFILASTGRVRLCVDVLCGQSQNSPCLQLLPSLYVFLAEVITRSVFGRRINIGGVKSNRAKVVFTQRLWKTMYVALHLAVGSHPLAGDAGRTHVGAVRALLVQLGVDLGRRTSEIIAYMT